MMTPHKTPPTPQALHRDKRADQPCLGLGPSGSASVVWEVTDRGVGCEAREESLLARLVAAAGSHWEPGEWGHM